MLVVDDNAINRGAVRAPLEALGWPVEEVGDGAAAVARATGSGVVAILMDCEMPGMDGFAATAALRETGSTVRVIGFTSLSGDARQRCLAAGMDDHLAKPATPLALALALSDLGNDTIDARRLALLGNGRSGHALVAELIDMFVRSIPVRVGALRDAVELADATNLRFVAHSLRGSAANLGLDALSRACAELEDAAIEGRLADAARMLDAIVVELDAARDALMVLAPR